MSSRKEITKKISLILEKHLNPKNDSRIYYAKEVTFDYATSHAIRVDYMLFKPVNNSTSGLEHGNFYCYEIKSCLEDFNSGHGLNFIGDYNYIVTTADVYEQIQKKLSWKVGVYVANASFTDIECIKKAQRMDRKYPILDMLFMMYRSSNRELYKANKWNYCSIDMTEEARKLPKEVINPLTLDYQEYICLCEFEGQRDIRTYKFGKNHWWHGAGIVDKYVIAWKDMPTQPLDI